MADLPQDLIRQIQSHTGTPWWNGQAYAESVGYHALAVHATKQIAVIEQVIESLRAAKMYEQSDALRGVVAQLRRAEALVKRSN